MQSTVHKTTALLTLAYDPETRVLERQKKHRESNPLTGSINKITKTISIMINNYRLLIENFR